MFGFAITDGRKANLKQLRALRVGHERSHFGWNGKFRVAICGEISYEVVFGIVSIEQFEVG